MLCLLMLLIKLLLQSLLKEYTDDDGQIKEMPVVYLSAQFNDTQFKWSTVVKEGYAI